MTLTDFLVLTAGWQHIKFREVCKTITQEVTAPQRDVPAVVHIGHTEAQILDDTIIKADGGIKVFHVVDITIDEAGTTGEGVLQVVRNGIPPVYISDNLVFRGTR